MDKQDAEALKNDPGLAEALKNPINIDKIEKLLREKFLTQVQNEMTKLQTEIEALQAEIDKNKT